MAKNLITGILVLACVGNLCFSVLLLLQLNTQKTQLDLVRAVSPGMAREAIIERLGPPRQEAEIEPSFGKLPCGRDATKVMGYSTTNPHLVSEDLEVYLNKEGCAVAVVHKF